MIELNARRVAAAFPDLVSVVLPPQSPNVEIAEKLPGFQRVTVSFQHPLRRLGEDVPGGTAYAVLAGWPSDAGTVILANGDDLYDAETWLLANKIVQAMASGECHGGAVAYRADATVPHEGAVNRALLTTSGSSDETLTLTGSQEIYSIERRGMSLIGIDGDQRPIELSADALVSMNIWILPRDFHPFLESSVAAHQESARLNSEWQELLIQDVVKAWMESGEVNIRVEVCEGEWIGLTHPADLPRATNFLKHARARTVLREFAMAWPLIDVVTFDEDSVEAVFDVGGHLTSYILTSIPTPQEAQHEFDLIERYRRATRNHHFAPHDCLSRVRANDGLPYVIHADTVYVLQHKLQGVRPTPQLTTKEEAFALAYRFAMFARDINAESHPAGKLFLHGDPRHSRVLQDLETGIPLAITGLRHYAEFPITEEVERLKAHVSPGLHEALANGYREAWKGWLSEEELDRLRYLPQ